MALTTEEQQILDQRQAAVAMQLAVENGRHANQMETQAIQVRLEAVRLAKETLIENARSKPADSREVTAADINTFAGVLMGSIIV